MDDDTLQAVAGRAYADPFPHRFLTALIEAGPRLGGSPGERRAAELVADAFDAVGADSELLPFEMQRWERGSAELTVTVERPSRTVDRSFDAVALPYSPGDTVRAPLTDLGHGTPAETDTADVAGTVALADTDSPTDGRYVHRMEKYGAAVDAGAAAFVFTHGEPGQLVPTGTLRFGHEGEVPAVGVSHETGAWLREYASEGADVRIRVDATTELGTSHNVLGQVGADGGDGILLVGHLDAHDVAEGALDNGCGITTVATAARYLADCALDCPVWVAGVGCEETGLLGAEALADRLDTERLRAVVNVDGAGRHRDLRALVHGSAALGDHAARVGDATGQPVHVEETPHPYSDHWPFLRAGVPTVQLHSQPATGHERGRGWGHTAADTRDKVDQRNLRAHAVLTTLLVADLAGASVPRIEASALRDRLETTGAEPGMRAAGVWPASWD
jgi:Zn-dependent M28 family amino/carboxypeptidase